MAMSTWREVGGKGLGKGRARARIKREQEREEGSSSPFYSGPGLNGCCQITVGLEYRQNSRGLGHCPT